MKLSFWYDHFETTVENFYDCGENREWRCSFKMDRSVRTFGHCRGIGLIKNNLISLPLPRKKYNKKWCTDVLRGHLFEMFHGSTYTVVSLMNNPQI